MRGRDESGVRYRSSFQRAGATRARAYAPGDGHATGFPRTRAIAAEEAGSGPGRPLSRSGAPSGAFRSVASERKVAASEPRSVVPERKVAASDPRSVVPERKVAASEPRSVVPERKVAASEPRSVVPERKVAASEPRSVVPERKVAASDPRSVAPDRKVALSELRLVAPERKVAVERAPLGRERAKGVRSRASLPAEGAPGVHNPARRAGSFGKGPRDRTKGERGSLANHVHRCPHPHRRHTGDQNKARRRRVGAQRRVGQVSAGP